MTMPFPRLFITDLDGTALGGEFEPYARLPEPFCCFLDRLSDNGCEWAINTTWDIGGQWDLVMDSPVKSKPTYLMAEFGLRMAEVAREGPTLVQPYTDENERKLAAFNKEIGYEMVRDICNRLCAAKMMFYGHLFSFTSIPEEEAELQSYVRESYGSMPEIDIKSNGNQFSFRPSFLSKGNAVREVVRLTGLRSDDVIVAGDERDDISMVGQGAAGLLIGPENCVAEVQQEIVAMNGVVGKGHGCLGVINAFEKLVHDRGWKW